MVECTALYNFKPKEGDELEFNQGDILLVKGPEQDGAGTGWLSAQLNGREGLVPANYLSKPPAWFFPSITRKNAEILLMQEGNGAFLVRRSESSGGLYSLSVKYHESVQHFRILQDSACKFHLWIIKFPSLNALVDYYRTTSVTRENQTPGLKTSGNVITLVDMQRVEYTLQKYPYLLKSDEESEATDNGVNNKSSYGNHGHNARGFPSGAMSASQNSWNPNMGQPASNRMRSSPNSWEANAKPQGMQAVEQSRQPRLQALYDFDPEEEGELCFRKGDIITLVDKPTKDWWRGTINGRIGMLPAPYVKVL